MLPNLTLQSRKGLLLTFTSIIIFASLIFFSCRKTDLAQSSLQHDANFTARFFKTNSTNKEVLRIIEVLKAENERTGFVNNLPANCGIPVWDKLALKKKQNITASFGPEDSTGNIIIIPLTSNNADLSSIIRITPDPDGYDIDCYTTNDYLLRLCNSAITPTEIATAEKALGTFMFMENRVWGTRKFYHIPVNLFADPGYHALIMSDGKRMMEISAVPDTSTIPGIMPTFCWYVPDPEHCICTQGPANCQDWWQGCPDCSNRQCMWDDPDDWPEIPPSGPGNPPPSPPGGGSGGGTPPTNPPPPEEPCPFSGAWYGFVPVYEPCVPPEEPNQSELDLQWMNNHIKDSTNNQCVTNVLTSLKSLDSTVPNLIRNFFDSSNLGFTMILKIGNNGPGEGAHTISQTTSDTFNTVINSYYQNATDLAVASTLIHENFHCQLLYWFRHAVLLKDTVLQQRLANDYGYLFTTQIINFDSTLSHIVNGGGPLQHQDMAVRYITMIGNALYNFAQKRGIPASISYCRDLAWAGLPDSRAFRALPFYRRTEITEKLNAEKDPYGATININNIPYKGVVCL